MLNGNAIRHQMILPEQQAIYDYWRSRCREGHFPSRFDIEPEHITAHLPMVTLTEHCLDGPTPRFRFRLAGTGFWSLYEDEIQGRFVDELPIGDRKAYWQRVLSDIIVKRRPRAGVTRTGTPSGSHLAQFWIRLPLSSDGRTIDTILGYDHLVKLSSLSNVDEELTQIYA